MSGGNWWLGGVVNSTSSFNCRKKSTHYRYVMYVIVNGPLSIYTSTTCVQMPKRVENVSKST